MRSMSVAHRPQTGLKGDNSCHAERRVSSAPNRTTLDQAQIRLWMVAVPRRSVIAASSRTRAAFIKPREAKYPICPGEPSSYLSSRAAQGTGVWASGSGSPTLSKFSTASSRM